MKLFSHICSITIFVLLVGIITPAFTGSGAAFELTPVLVFFMRFLNQADFASKYATGAVPDPAPGKPYIEVAKDRLKAELQNAEGSLNAGGDNPLLRKDAEGKPDVKKASCPAGTANKVNPLGMTLFNELKNEVKTKKKSFKSIDVLIEFLGLPSCQGKIEEKMVARWFTQETHSIIATETGATAIKIEFH